MEILQARALNFQLRCYYRDVMKRSLTLLVKKSEIIGAESVPNDDGPNLNVRFEYKMIVSSVDCQLVTHLNRCYSGLLCCSLKLFLYIVEFLFKHKCAWDF